MHMNIRQTVHFPRRVLSLALCAAMVLTLLPLPARAEGICEHHPEHTADCGYKAAVAGQDCGHRHDESCGYQEASPCTHSHDASCGYREASNCAHQHTEECGENGESCTHSHDGSCGYQEAENCTHSHDDACGYREARTCTHTHDNTCGFVAAVAGSPCTYQCEICAQQQNGQDLCAHGNDLNACEACASDAQVASVQKLIDALPETVTEENREAAQSALSAVDTAKAALTEAEQEKLNLTRYTALKALLAEQDSPNTGKVITDWEWDDGFEIVDEESGYVVLPFTAEAFTANFEQVKEMLPEAILVGEEALTLGNWTYETGEEGAVVTIDSESCPSPGSFQTTLPEGYVLADGTNVLSLTVALSAGSSEDTSSYANSDTLTNVSYYDAKGMPQTCPSATKVVENKVKDGPNTTWTTGWYVVEGTVEIGGTIFLDPGTWQEEVELYKSVSVQGDVNLILKEGSKLQMLHGHIDVPEGSSLTVYCDNTSNSGTLKVWGANNHAAIGGSPDSPDSGRITINGGTVNASSSWGGAGIGSGDGGSAGDITINGGNIEATANYGGAGIGTGKNGKSATITINNCNKINARSSSGAGIGSGEESSGEGMVTVNIYGGTEIISKSASGAGIGSGKGSQANVTVNITGGDIYAQTTGLGEPPDHGAAIGGGYGATNTTVNIGGTAKVGASGGKTAPGIGSIDPACSVTITGGTVEAWGGEQAAGIGGAYLRDSCPVTIAGGTVTAYGGNTGAGIGSGCGGTSTVRYNTGRIEISGGTVTANGSYFAAGIGGGEYNTAGDILISGGTVIANRNTSNDTDIRYPAKDVGDGANDNNLNHVYSRYTLDGSAKLYLQNGYKEPSVQDATRPKISSGYIFSGTPETYTAIRVYGSQTLSENFCIETGKTMTVMSDASLNTGSNKLYVKGTLAKEDTGSASGNIYYPLTLTSCTASGNTSTYGDTNELFGKAGSTITLTPTLPSGYKFNSWETNPAGLITPGNSFRMPEQATTVKAKGKLAVEITQQPENKTITYFDDASLSVTAVNSNGTAEEITYQWYKDGTSLERETSATLSLKYLDANTVPYTFYCAVTYDGVTVNSNEVTVTVNKAASRVTINDAPGKTYDGKPVSAPGFTINFGSGSVTIEYKLQSEPDSAYTETAPTDAGNYTVRVTLPESKNFTEASDTKDFTISKATDNEWLTSPAVTDFTYGATVTSPVAYQAKYGNDKVQVTYKKQGTEDTPSKDVPKDAGTYDVTVSLAETDSYPALAPVNLTLTISKVAPAFTAPTGKTVVYTGKALELTEGAETSHGTMQYRLGEEGEWSTAVPKATDCGTYTVWYKVVGDNNHTNTEPASVTAKILPFAINEEPQDTTINYGENTALTFETTTALEGEVTYQWCLVTVEVGKEIYTPLEGETSSELTLTKPNAGTYVYACIVTCGDYSETSAKATVTVTPVEIPAGPGTGIDLSGFWLEGGEAPASENQTKIPEKSPSSRLLTKYTYNGTSNDAHQNYPTGMQIYSVETDDQGNTTVAPVAELGNLLRYSGCSIRITGKPGIRMITSLTKEAKAALTKANLAGYTLEEYGTVAVWSSDLDNQPLTLNTKKSRSNYAYKRGVSDPVFANVGALTQYTNVLVWDSLEDKKYDEDIVMRPYIKLSKGGETVTLYGGTVSRSIGYVAQQNANTFAKGTAGYKYVHEIIDKVNALNSSTGTNTTTGGNG